MLYPVVLYLIIGILMGLFFMFLLKKHFLGEVVGAIIIGVIGAVLGGSLLKEPIVAVYTFIYQTFRVDIFSSLIGSFIFVWVFSLVSPNKHER